jgi:branched-chain amino acid transport system permease protein
MELGGLVSFGVFFLTLVGIYAVLALGLNVQWGLTGLFNIGIAAFFAVGAYTSAIVTTPHSPVHLGGFELPIAVGLLTAMVTSGILAVLVGLVTLRLREDYLAIASIGIAEIVRLVLKNEEWLTNGVRGIPGIPQPLEGFETAVQQVSFLVLVIAAVVLVYLALERARQSPWGRVLRAIREREIAALAAGKDIVSFRLQAFVLGSMIMGLAGALYAHFVSFISPEAFDPMYATFLVWVMLIAGGSGNNRGAILGAFTIWVVWSGTEYLSNMLPPEMITRASAIRLLLVGVLLEVILLLRPQGILPERRFVSTIRSEPDER